MDITPNQIKKLTKNLKGQAYTVRDLEETAKTLGFKDWNSLKGTDQHQKEKTLEILEVKGNPTIGFDFSIDTLVCVQAGIQTNPESLKDICLQKLLEKVQKGEIKFQFENFFDSEDGSYFTDFKNKEPSARERKTAETIVQCPKESDINTLEKFKSRLQELPGDLPLVFSEESAPYRKYGLDLEYDGNDPQLEEHFEHWEKESNCRDSLRDIADAIIITHGGFFNLKFTPDTFDQEMIEPLRKKKEAYKMMDKSKQS
jgi:hypothetical protein